MYNNIVTSGEGLGVDFHANLTTTACLVVKAPHPPSNSPKPYQLLSPLVQWSFTARPHPHRSVGTIWLIFPVPNLKMS